MKLLDYNNRTTSIGKLHILIKDYMPLFVSVIPTIVIYTKESELIYNFNAFNIALIVCYSIIFIFLSLIVLTSNNVNNFVLETLEFLANSFTLLAQFHSIHYFMYKSDKKWQDSFSILFPSIVATIYVIFHDRFKSFLRTLLTWILSILFSIIPYTICMILISIIEKRFRFSPFSD